MYGTKTGRANSLVNLRKKRTRRSLFDSYSVWLYIVYNQPYCKYRRILAPHTWYCYFKLDIKFPKL